MTDVPIAFLILDARTFADAVRGLTDNYLLHLDEMPPIKISDDFHVRDGHKRVATAIRLGRTTIKAEVV
ncbi:MAG: hypothetical protein ABSF15_24175 [Candidatus Sulfotelmatobacter sp.]|jgi:hypothetical protein